MAKKALNLKIVELTSDLGILKNEVSVGRIFDESWTEPVGPTPYAKLSKLRSWDHKLLSRYKPFYMPDDIDLFVRTLTDVPITMKDELVMILKKKGWEEGVIPDPTLLQRMVRMRR